jgi:hypothetical protein
MLSIDHDDIHQSVIDLDDVQRNLRSERGNQYGPKLFPSFLGPFPFSYHKLQIKCPDASAHRAIHRGRKLAFLKSALHFPHERGDRGALSWQIELLDAGL